MSKHFLVFFLAFAFLFLNPSRVLAAKTRIWTTQTTAKTTATTTRPTFSVKFRSDRKALNVGFYSLNTASSTSYELIYTGNDLEQGVVGSINPNEGSSASRLLLFGSCSRNVCTYHKNISGMRLKIISKLKSGKTLTKTYKIKV